jgi:D-glycero-D-manno-heptose 1,7-bisphosphate phosphatase
MAVARGVFLDRDGTLIRAFERDGVSVPPASLEQLEVLPGVPRALESLRQAGFALIVVTNQPDVARGTQTRDMVEAINQRLSELLSVDLIMSCFHDDADHCSCRKPEPGLLVDGAGQLGLHLARSYMVGDRWRDILAGQRAGCATILLRNRLDGADRVRPDFEVADLSEAAEIILQSRQKESREDLC